MKLLFTAIQCKTPEWLPHPEEWLAVSWYTFTLLPCINVTLNFSPGPTTLGHPVKEKEKQQKEETTPCLQ